MLVKCGGFKFLEHTADAYVEASGHSIEEVFEWMAKAMFEVMTDMSKVEPRVRMGFRGKGIDLEGVLYRWLEDLLIAHDAEGMLFSKFKVHRVWKDCKEYKYEAEAWGERADPSKHEFRIEVKAVTYSLMEIRREGECWIARVVFDL